MEKFCITTLITKSYQYYAPLFAYSIRRAYPDLPILIFANGEIRPEIREATDATIIDDAFPQAKKGFVNNALRLLVPDEFLKPYKYILFSDVDLLFCRHKKSHLDYYRSVIHKTGQHYAGFRGGATDWRICAGMFCVDRHWLRLTKKYRAAYRNKLYDRKITKYTHDEVMLYNICHKAGLKTPTKRRFFCNGKRFNYNYRDIHFGDAKFAGRIADRSKMRMYMTAQSAKEGKRMFKEERFKELLELVFQSKYVRKNVNRMKLYLKTR